MLVLPPLSTMPMPTEPLFSLLLGQLNLPTVTIDAETGGRFNKNWNWNLRGRAVLASKDAGFDTVETTYFDSALDVMGVKAAAFPSFAGGSTTDRSTTRDYETGNERAATRYRTEGTGLGSAYSDSGAGGSGSTSMGGTVTFATE